jgi:hypothetical protein
MHRDVREGCGITLVIWQASDHRRSASWAVVVGRGCFVSRLSGKAGRKRKRAAIASFAKWAVRHDLLQANPMDRIDTVKVPKALPRPAADVAKVLAAICTRRPRKDLPLDRLRDRVLFERGRARRLAGRTIGSRAPRRPPQMRYCRAQERCAIPSRYQRRAAAAL